jgi:hypothetical protein
MRRLRAGVVGVLAAAGAAAVAAALMTGPGGASADAPPAVRPAAATASSAPTAEIPAPPAAEDHGDLSAELERWIPAGLRDELAALRDVPAAERLVELERIRDAALAGEYGEQARAAAERLVAALAMLPPELSADLESLVPLEGRAIADAVERMRDRALAGEYGPRVRGHAERLIAGAGQHGYDVRGDLHRYVAGS